MNSRVSEFQAILSARRAVKVIAGIANYDLDNILAVVRAATVSGASAVDVAAKAEIVKEVRKATNLTVFASCIKPANLAMAVENGADVAEIGNYDALYAEGLYFTADEVLKIAEETVRRVGDAALVSVTLPGHLSIDTQIQMAKTLAGMGVHMLQTEGASRTLTAEPQIKTLSAEEKAEITFSNTRVLAMETTLPLMSASGITAENITHAFTLGAAAVGVGSAVNKLSTEADMTAVVAEMMTRVNALKAEPKQFSKVS